MKKVRSAAIRAMTLILLIALSYGIYQSPALARPGKPALHLVSASGYRIAVRGDGWPSSGRVALAVRSGPWVSGIVLRATRAGTFVVGVRNINLCGGSLFQAHDLSGHAAVVHGPALMCPSPVNPPRPTLAVLAGSQMKVHTGHTSKRSTTQMQEIRLLAPHGPQSVKMRRGDALYVWEPGSQRPAFQASADPAYLSLTNAGTTPPRMCPQVDCAAGYYWEWVAIRAGTTAVDLSPACRASRPPCGMPDFGIRVTISP